MKTVTLQFDAESFSQGDEPCHEIEVTVEVSATCEDDYDYEATFFDTVSQVERSLSDFSEAEQALLTKMCEEAAYDNAWDAYQEYLQCEADALYDRMRDGD